MRLRFQLYLFQITHITSRPSAQYSLFTIPRITTNLDDLVQNVQYLTNGPSYLPDYPLCPANGVQTTHDFPTCPLRQLRAPIIYIIA